MSRKRQIGDLTDSQPHDDLIFTSNAINDRSSTFIGRYSPTANARTLQASPDFKDATHRMTAWRKPSNQRVIAAGSQSQRRLYDTGSDDDGEKYGGKKLENLLDDMQVEGAVVVARWYGGVMLGPVRFTHIESCAREAILQSRKVKSVEDGQVEKRQKMQQEDDKVRKAKLEQLLPQRDSSISVLRGLLAEKSMVNGAVDKPPSTPGRQLDYSKMPLAALIKLEKARDATIAFLLEQISNAEAACAAKDAPGTVKDEQTAISGPPAVEIDSNGDAQKVETTIQESADDPIISIVAA